MTKLSRRDAIALEFAKLLIRIPADELMNDSDFVDKGGLLVRASDDSEDDGYEDIAIYDTAVSMADDFIEKLDA